MSKAKDDLIPRPLSHFDKEIEEVEQRLQEIVSAIVTSKEKSKYASLAHDAEWHIKGLRYHFKKILTLYEEICGEVSVRAMMPQQPSVMVFHNPNMQSLLFEFYALVVLSRTTLDHTTQYTLAPLFGKGTLPGSVNDFMKGTSNINLHDYLNKEPMVRYLVDLRDCMVHFRTFATSDNTIAISDTVDAKKLAPIDEHWKWPVVRTFYRIVDEYTMSINLLLPDKIYEYDGQGARTHMVKEFSYQDRNNVLRYSMAFIQVCATFAIAPLRALYEDDSQQYTWRKRSKKA